MALYPKDSEDRQTHSAIGDGEDTYDTHPCLETKSQTLGRCASSLCLRPGAWILQLDILHSRATEVKCIPISAEIRRAVQTSLVGLGLRGPMLLRWKSVCKGSSFPLSCFTNPIRGPWQVMRPAKLFRNLKDTISMLENVSFSQLCNEFININHKRIF